MLTALLERRQELFPWVPVLFGIGIGVYFALPAEPGPVALTAILALATLCGLGFLRAPFLWRPVFAVVFLMTLGVGWAQIRTLTVAAPVLEYRAFGPLEGRVRIVDRSGSGAPRVTLDEVWMADLRREETPRRVRISLVSPYQGDVPEPGQRIAVTANMSGPAAPAEPGGFNFQRQAWFKGIGAVGYTRDPSVLLAPAQGWSVIVGRIRARLSAGIQARVAGDNGAFAAAILTGDRSAMSPDTVEALRDANMAHLLAISGLHMGLLTGFIFAALRYGMALIPPAALRIPAKKWAAFLALLAAAFYLALSGGIVATQRAFIMVLVMLVAIMLDRRALTLRAVALAAMIVLILRPESLTEPGFQMSFAATTALVVVFGLLRDLPETAWRPPAWTRPVLAVFLSSLVAGLATAPFAAAHFNQVAQYGLLANVLSVPLVGTIVIPAAVLGGVLAPFGLEAPALWVMELGIRWVLGVAHFVAGLEGSTWPVVSPPQTVLPLVALGMLWLMLWPNRARVAAVAPLCAGLILWSQASRPDVLITESGALVGVMTEAGRVLSKERSEQFAARSWLENDGDAAVQAGAHSRDGFAHFRGGSRIIVGGVVITQLHGRGWQDVLPGACADGLVIAARVIEDAPQTCNLLDQRSLRRTGALAITVQDGKVQVTSAKDRSGDRPWTR
ncbi:hypothetical protein ACMU_17575 [Actibacterium mucosum KCTC 23349]|uniref:Competence protein n=1 Tax=Actibacterium mucosum KCTC 23349 TaxID=1454373 RepID=A0A037ZFY0_9RHOB|nr:ComEC/Rec2 family competence protein [Actibacterium mucosum]KAJ54518.1 hypothetical protein ACMU_17575 [Actibacterium mucosum KCTC 23349]